MTIKDLKVGDICTLKCGNTHIISSDTDLKNFHKYWNEDMTGLHISNSTIMKVQRYILEPAFIRLGKEPNSYIIHTDLYRLKTIYERKEILDDVEKEYLRGVIRPFRDRNIFIAKYNNSHGEYICYGFKGYSHNYDFPSFKKGTMYKGMELHKEYTLEELGL